MIGGDADDRQYVWDESAQEVLNDHCRVVSKTTQRPKVAFSVIIARQMLIPERTGTD